MENDLTGGSTYTSTSRFVPDGAVAGVKPAAAIMPDLGWVVTA